MVLNERKLAQRVLWVRATPSGSLLVATRRAGALFALSCVNIRLFGATQPRSFRRAENKQGFQQG